MSDVPEYSYRSKDVLYEVYLPSCATRRESVDLVLTNPDDEDDQIRVRAQDVDTEPTLEVLEKLAKDGQSFLREPSVKLWTGEIGGRRAVRRTTTGSVSWFSERNKASLTDDVVCVGVEKRTENFVAGSISRVTQAGSQLAGQDLLSDVFPVYEQTPDVGDDRILYKLRGFSVSALESWEASVEGLRGENDYGPAVPDPWGGEEPASGHIVKWRITGFIPELASSVSSIKDAQGLQLDEHGPLAAGPPPVGSLPIKDYMIVDVPALRHARVPARGMDGEDILIDDPRDKYAHRFMAVWFKLGPTGGCLITLRVEHEALSQWGTLWSSLASALKIEER